MKTAIFPGSFDPFTLGHASMVERGLSLFDRIVIAVGVNTEKKSMFTPAQRVAQIKACYLREPRVEVCSYEGLTVDIARNKQAAFILRSIRTVADDEYERQMAVLNRQLSGNTIETVILVADAKYEYVQSSVVRELIKFGQDISGFVPEQVLTCMKNK